MYGRYLLRVETNKYGEKGMGLFNLDPPLKRTFLSLYIDTVNNL